MPWVLVIAILVVAWPGAAAGGNGRDVFFDVLQGVVGEVERQHHHDQAARQSELQSLLHACFDGSGPACDVALRHPRLDADGRRAVRNQVRALDEVRATQQRAYQNFTVDWAACQDAGDPAACDRALIYSPLGDKDRRKLEAWKQARIVRDLTAQRAEHDRQTALAQEQAQARRRAETDQLSRAGPAIANVPLTTASLPEESSVTAPSTPQAADAFAVVLIVLTMAVCAAAFANSSPRLRFAAGFGRVAEPTPLTGRAERPSAHNHSDDVSDVLFPLTGHFPTDVRRVLVR